MFLNFFGKHFIYLLLQREEVKEKGRETPTCERNIDWLLLAYWPAAQAWALSRNRTCDFLVHRPVLNPLSHSSQGFFFFFLFFFFHFLTCIFPWCFNSYSEYMKIGNLEVLTPKNSTNVRVKSFYLKELMSKFWLEEGEEDKYSYNIKV